MHARANVVSPRISAKRHDESRLEATIHALMLGAAAAVFVFVLCWAGDATGSYPAVGRLLDLINMAAERRSSDAFWHGARSAAVMGAAIGAVIALCANAMARTSRPRFRPLV